jgi:hypothetical protein
VLLFTIVLFPSHYLQALCADPQPLRGDLQAVRPIFSPSGRSLTSIEPQSYYKKCTYASKFAKNLTKTRARLRMCEIFRTFARFIAYKF